MIEHVELLLDREAIRRLERLTGRLERSAEVVVQDALLVYEGALELAVAQDKYVNGGE